MTGRAFVITIASILILTPCKSDAAERFAGDFLMLGSGARALGMGETAVAVSDDATSVYYNPAGLSGMTGPSLNLMHSEQFGGLENYNTFSAAAPLSDDIYVGAALIHLGVGDIKYTRLWDPSKALSDSNRVEIASREDANDYSLFLSGAKRFSDKLSTGINVKLIRRSIASDTAFGFGIDAGIRFIQDDNWVFGAILRDLTGTTIAWDGHSSDRIAPTLDTGVAFRGTLPFFGGPYTLSGSMVFFGDSPRVKGLSTMHIGLEYRIIDVFTVRAGSSEGNASFGAGIMRLPMLSSTSLDYAFISHESLDSTHRLSLEIRL